MNEMNLKNERTEQVQCDKLGYVEPQSEVIEMELQQFLAVSGDTSIGDLDKEDW